MIILIAVVALWLALNALLWWMLPTVDLDGNDSRLRPI